MILKKKEILESNKKTVSAICFFLIIFLAIIDIMSGYDFGFFVFYFIPVLIAGYYLDNRSAVLYSLLATLSWFIADIVTEHEYSYEIFRYWNSLIRLAAFLLVGYVISYNRKLLIKEKELNFKLEKALSEVKNLTGLLPICASCKKIRNDGGYWEQVEDYIKTHSEAEFSHSICPSCMEKLYPSVMQKRKEKLEAAEKNETPR